jgi:hypothetical protein
MQTDLAESIEYRRGSGLASVCGAFCETEGTAHHRDSAFMIRWQGNAANHI